MATPVTLPRAPRRNAEPVVPMINVVFLLLIFFLMTAQIAPQAPFQVTLPQAAAEDIADAPPPLFVSAEGLAAFGALRGDSALAAAARAGAVRIEADARLDARDLARLLAALGAEGATQITLTTRRAP